MVLGLFNTMKNIINYMWKLAFVYSSSKIHRFLYCLQYYILLHYFKKKKK